MTGTRLLASDELADVAGSSMLLQRVQVRDLIEARHSAKAKDAQ